MRALVFACLFLLACPAPVTNVNELCKAGAAGRPAAATALVTGRRIKSLSLGSDALVYIDPAGTGTLRRVALDGTNDTVLYGPPAQGKLLFDALVVGDAVWLTEQENQLTGTVTRLLKVPLAGGAVTSVDLAQPAVFFVKNAPSESAVYVKTSNSGSAMSTVFRMTADGTLTKIVGGKNMENALVTEDSLFFMTRPSIGDDAASRSLHRSTKQADAVDAAVGTVFCRSSFFVTASGAILCSGYSSTGTGSPSSSVVTKLDIAGTNASTFLDLSDEFGGSFLSASVEVGDEVLFTLSGPSDTYPVLATKLSTGAVRALACDAAVPALKTGTARPDLVSNGESVFWVGAGPNGVGNDTLLKAAVR
jgi:hypothetical protein